MTDLGTFIANYGVVVATVGLVLATLILAWHTSKLVKATNSLTTIQVQPKVVLLSPMRPMNEGEFETMSKASVVVEVVNRGMGTALNTEVLLDEDAETIEANTTKLTRDLPQNETMKFVLPLPPKPSYKLRVKYDDIRGGHYDEILTWGGDIRTYILKEGQVKETTRSGPPN